MLFNLKLKIQKFLHGWNYLDCYSINNWFIDTLTPILKYHRFSMGFYPLPYKVDSKEEWDFILDKMLYHLHMMKIKNILEEKGIKNPTAAEYDLAYNIQNRNKIQFFDLFEKYFF